MDSDQAHIDQIIKEKLEQLRPTPPEHVWAGIEQGLADQKAPLFLFLYAKQFIAAAVLVLIALALWFFIPVNDKMQTRNIERIDETGQTETGKIVLPENTEEISLEKDLEPNALTEDNNADATNKTSTTKQNRQKVSAGIVAKSNPYNYLQEPLTIKEGFEDVHLVYLENKETTSLQLTDSCNSYSVEENENTVYLTNRKTPSNTSPAIVVNEMGNFENYWNIGLYFTPEMMMNSIDSVTLMNTYSLNIEPSWYFSRHWFMRFGIGVSYARDLGFAKVDFVSNDYIGTYDSVVEVTFEEINNEFFPVYHTKEVEIWDSIRHLAITEITNEYYNIQLPLMFGYHNSTRNFKWYFYGGPAMNISISKQIDDPKTNIEYIEIINLENRLPQRTDYSLQLWIGAGIDFRIGQKFSLAIEPNYRYYFKPVYQENNYKTALSGLGIRFGLIYKLNRK